MRSKLDVATALMVVASALPVHAQFSGYGDVAGYWIGEIMLRGNFIVEQAPDWVRYHLTAKSQPKMFWNATMASGRVSCPGAEEGIFTIGFDKTIEFGLDIAIPRSGSASAVVESANARWIPAEANSALTSLKIGDLRFKDMYLMFRTAKLATAGALEIQWGSDKLEVFASIPDWAALAVPQLRRKIQTKCETRQSTNQAIDNRDDAVTRQSANQERDSKNDGMTMSALRTLADQGDQDAQNRLGLIYANGRAVPRDYSEAMNWFRKAALGNAPAQNNLGMMYATGRGVTKNEGEAVVWYQKAVAQGFGPAKDNLDGAMKWEAFRALGREDYAAAMRILRPLADQGDSDAQNNVGLLFAKGEGVPRNDAEALNWFGKAASHGNAAAQNNLGVMHANGRGVPQNDTEALGWYKKAADQGFSQAAMNLAAMPDWVSLGESQGVKVFIDSSHIQGTGNIIQILDRSLAKEFKIRTRYDYSTPVTVHDKSVDRMMMQSTIGCLDVSSDREIQIQFFHRSLPIMTIDESNASNPYWVARPTSLDRDMKGKACEIALEKPRRATVTLSLGYGELSGRSELRAYRGARSTNGGASLERIYKATDGGITMPKAIRSPAPPYTPEAKKALLQGSVGLAGIIHKDGTYEVLQITKKLGLGLDEKAVETVSKWQFQPAQRDGQSVAMEAAFEANFSLR